MKLFIACVTALLACLLVPFTTAIFSRRIQARTFCPADFILLHEHCYYFSQEVMNSWDEAWRLCQELDSRAVLVNIETVREWKNLKTYLLEEQLDKKNWWIGGSDRELEGRWMWMGTNQPFAFSDWCPSFGNDNAGGVENCAHITNTSTVPTHQLCWNDLPCTHPKDSYQLHFICEV